MYREYKKLSRDKLVKIIRTQLSIIFSLKYEIHQLKKKGIGDIKYFFQGVFRGLWTIVIFCVVFCLGTLLFDDVLNLPVLLFSDAPIFGILVVCLIVSCFGVNEIVKKSNENHEKTIEALEELDFKIKMKEIGGKTNAEKTGKNK